MANSITNPLFPWSAVIGEENTFTAEVSDRPTHCPRCNALLDLQTLLHSPTRNRDGDNLYWKFVPPCCNIFLTLFND